MSHSKTPWVTKGTAHKASNFGGYNCIISSYNGDHYASVAKVYGGTKDDRDECEANAAFIVRACNSHEELVLALKAMLDNYTALVNSGDCGNWNPEDESPVRQAQAALAKVNHVA